MVPLKSLLFRPWLTFFLFWNIVNQRRQPPPPPGGSRQGLEATVTGSNFSKFARNHYISKQKECEWRTKQKTCQWSRGQSTRQSPHFTEFMCRRLVESNETFAILSASTRAFYERIIFSALKKLMDIRWILSFAVTCVQMDFMDRKNDRNQISVPWPFLISPYSKILIFLVLFPFIKSQPKYQNHMSLAFTFSN